MAEHHLRLSADLTSARRSRLFVRDVCDDERLHPDTTDLVQLVVSELVTNGVVHGCSETELRLSVEADTVRGEVIDYGAGMPRFLAAPLGAERGRGLAIVDATTSSWGVRSDPPGKAVWFEVPLSARLGQDHTGQDDRD